MPTFSFQSPPGDTAFAKPKTVRMGAARYEAESWAKVERKRGGENGKTSQDVVGLMSGE